MFIDELIERIIKTKNHSIVGIDLHEGIIPQSVRDKNYNPNVSRIESITETMFQFSKEIINSIYDIVPAIKPQIAFFERYGSHGFKAFEKICKYAMNKALIVLADVKRSDIGSTAAAYSDYYLGTDFSSLSVDAITINPYFGEDSLIPFVDNCIKNNKGLFVLVKTSNKSSGDLQNRVCEGKKIYETVSELVTKQGMACIGKYGYSSIGAVVGATHKEDGENIRKLMKSTYFLVPGYGAQGGKASDLGGFFNEDGLGSIINSSRGIIGAYMLDKYKGKFDEDSYALAAREAVIDMRDDINKILEAAGKIAW
ncbi:MAG: orotidine-5'-phosphate decarboxylase [Clostridiales bacterium]|nr:orotidine-5'-phosphate decarboxylase [Clostridiales bacterium]